MRGQWPIKPCIMRKTRVSLRGKILRQLSYEKGRFAMFDKMKGLMEMKKQADRIKKELDASLVEVNEVSGIKIVVNGSQNFKSFEIDDTLVSGGNKKELEANILRGVNEAIKKSQNLAAQKMRAVMPGFPGM
jgi:DNA-binding YbaB/EbfC family protein